MKKRVVCLLVALCMVLTAAPFAYAATAPSSFDAYMTMTKLRSEYPEGTPWTNDNVYEWKGGIYNAGYGCAGFAFMLSDAVFGDLPARKLTNVFADELRPGDILRINNDTHSVIVLQNTPYGIVVAEGNYNSSVHWDRVISRADAESADYVLTRYPEGWVDAAPAEPILESTQITNALNWLEKSFPQDMYWGYDYTYYWQGGILNGSAGSYAFAMLLSDNVFSNLPACTKQGMTLAELRVGDIVVDEYGAAGIVVEKLGDRVRLAEGQDGGVVDWHRIMGESELSRALMTITRYPDAQGTDGELSLEQQAQNAMNGLRDQYPEGMSWSNNDSYQWNGVQNETGRGCFAFAYILSDAAFGDLPARNVTDFTFEDVRAGDILVDNGYSMIVLETYDDAVMIAEGEYNGGIHWGRYLSREQVEASDRMITRYPADYQDPEVSVDIYQPDGEVLAEGKCGYKGAPVYWKVTDKGILVIYGSGATDNFNYIMNYNVPAWAAYADMITRVVVQEGVTELGSSTLANLSWLTDVSLPSTLKKIGADGFSQCVSLESIRLPQGLEELGNRAFSYCSALQYVNFPGSLKRIGSECFQNTALVRVELKSGLTAIDSNAFYSCKNLESVYIPGTVAEVGMYAFAYCTNLTSLTLSEGVTAVYASFAQGCENLTEVNLPSTLEYIGASAFEDAAISTLVLPESVTTLGDYAFSGSGLTSVTINHTVEEFGARVFSNCDQLVEVNIADGVETLGASAFYNCSALEYVSLPGSLDAVSVYAFAGYGSNLKVLVLEEGITTVSKFAFESCDNLKEIHLPASLTYVGECAFDNDNYMPDITIYYAGSPETWNEIEILYGNYSLESGTIIFGEAGECNHGALNIQPAVEPTCQTTGLTEGQVCQICGEVLAQQEVLGIVDHRYEYGECIWCGLEDPNAADAVLDSGECGDNVIWELRGDGTLVISGEGPMWDLTIYDRFLNNYKNRVKAIVIEPGVTSIGDFTLRSFSEAESITIGPDVQRIGNNAFSNSQALTYVEIPKSVTWIGEFAFGNCHALKRVDFLSGNVVLGNVVFSGCSMLETVNIPTGKTTFEGIGHFSATPFLETAGDSEGFVILNRNLIKYNGSEAEVSIPVIVKHIMGSAFSGNRSLQEVTFPANIQSIGEYAFYDCFNLKYINFLGDAPQIAENAFKNTYFPEAFFPNWNYTWTEEVLLSYGGNLMWRCDIFTPACQHKNIYIIVGTGHPTCTEPGSLDEILCNDCGKVLQEPQEMDALGHEWVDGICSRCGEKDPNAENQGPITGQCGDAVFWELTDDGTLVVSGTGPMWDLEPEDNCIPYELKERVTAIVVGPGITTVGNCAFWGCTNAKSVILGENVEKIGEHAFDSLCCLPSIEIPASVREVGLCAFIACEELKQVDFQSGYVTLKHGVFSYCMNLETVNIPEGRTIFEGHNHFDADSPFMRYAAGLDGFVIINHNLVKYTGYEWVVKVPSGVRHIVKDAFGEGPITVHIPASVMSVDGFAFENCPTLRAVIFYGDPPAIDEYAFASANSRTVEAQFSAHNSEWDTFAKQTYGGITAWNGVTNIDQCTHTPTIIENDYTVSCTQAGYNQEIICADCGKVIVEADQWQEALGHDWVDGTCTRCGEQNEVQGMLGDVDGNNTVNYKDAMVVLRASVGLEKLTEEQKALGDVDSSGALNYKDAMMILRYSVGLITEWGV